MKFYKYLFLILSVSFLMTSCEDSLDINENPLAATTADPNVVLPFVLVQYSNRHTTELGTRIMDVPQHFTACFNSPRAGNTSSFLTGNTWGMMYSQVLGNLLLMEQDALAAGETSNNVAAIAKTVKALTYLELTSLWERVPFTQALDAVNFPSPDFDEQEVVLDGVIAILDDAMALIDAIPAEGNFDVSGGDIIYGGNMDNWKRLANSLKVRTLMMLSNNRDVSAAASAALSQPVIESNAQAAYIPYADAAGQFNAYNNLVEAFFGVSNEAQGVYAPSETLYGLLDGDPRFDLIIANPDAEDPIPMGMFAFVSGGPTISDNVIRNSLPHMICMPAEMNLYRAELAMKAGDMGTADAEYRAGITNNMAWWGGDIPGAVMSLDATVASDYVAALAAPTLDDIYNQLYIESFIRPVVAWNHVRRTNVPALVAVPGSDISTILKRFDYPPDEVSSNVKTPANQPTDTPMWFE